MAYIHALSAADAMDRARAANHYNKQVHGAKAAQLLREAADKIHLAVEAAKNEM